MKQFDELALLLDQQIRLLQQKLSVMKQLGECVRSGDVAALDELLRQQVGLEEGSESLEQHMLRMRERIAAAMDLSPDQVTLGRLVESLNGPVAMALNDRRERLLLVVQKVQAESARLARLVRHALEFNNRLLAALLGAEQEGGTYSPVGALARGSDLSTYRQSV